MPQAPILIAAHLLDLLAVGFLALASLPAARVTLGWSPGSPARAQLARERAWEAGASAAALAGILLAAGVVPWAVALAWILPGTVPGAMCGTGVMEAMGEVGARALWTRAFAFAAIVALWEVHALDRRHPRAPLAPLEGRLVLLALPLVALAAWEAWRASARLAAPGVVDCCAVVYDVAGGLASSVGLSPTMPVALALLPASAVLLALVASGAARGRRAWLLPVATAAWIPLALALLLGPLVPYHYGVLGHHCPWCLLLPRQAFAGVALYGALAVVASAAVSIPVGVVATRGEPVLAAAGARRARRAAIAVHGALTVYVAVAAGPAVAWGIRHGAWW